MRGWSRTRWLVLIGLAVALAAVIALMLTVAGSGQSAPY
jgi:hypothetical protein